MNSFEWIDATSVERASTLLAGRDRALPVVAKAGGIDLLDLMKEGIVRPSRVVNLRTIPGLDALTRDATGALRIGALVTLARIADDADVGTRYRVLAEAARHAATPQVRNAATIGGNVNQRPRCWYYRSAHFHREGLDAASAAITGENQCHAIFDNVESAIVRLDACHRLTALGASIGWPEQGATLGSARGVPAASRRIA